MGRDTDNERALDVCEGSLFDYFMSFGYEFLLFRTNHEILNLIKITSGQRIGGP